MNNNQFATRRTRRGVSATEFAVSLPLLVSLCLVACDLGRYAYAAIALSNSARVGAEYGATRRVTEDSFPVWKSVVETRVLEELSSMDSRMTDSVEIDVNVSSLDDELPRVDVGAECTFHTIVDWWMIPDAIQLRRTYSVARYR